MFVIVIRNPYRPAVEGVAGPFPSEKEAHDYRLKLEAEGIHPDADMVIWPVLSDEQMKDGALSHLFAGSIDELEEE